MQCDFGILLDWNLSLTYTLDCHAQVWHFNKSPIGCLNMLLNRSERKPRSKKSDFVLYGETQLSVCIVDDESEDVRCVWLAMQLGRGERLKMPQLYYCIPTHTHSLPGSLIDVKMYGKGFMRLAAVLTFLCLCFYGKSVSVLSVSECERTILCARVYACTCWCVHALCVCAAVGCGGPLSHVRDSFVEGGSQGK